MFSLPKSFSLFGIGALLLTASAAMSQSRGDFISHTIKQGETLSALAKQNGTTVGDIMRLNGMNSKSQLRIGKIVKIPVGKVNSKPELTTVAPKEEEVKTPPVTVKQPTSSNVKQKDITIVVEKGQSLYGIAKKYKTTEAQIEAWNGLKNDKIRFGQTLIVGKEFVENATETVVVKPEVKKDDKTASLPDTKIDIKVPSKTVNQQSKQPESQSTETVLTAPSATVSKPKVVVEPANAPTVAQPTSIPANAKYVDKEGYFAEYFNRKEKASNTTTGTASIFKTTSGWQDKKYYILVNDIAQGTIVRLTANNKNVCAKVLGPLPDIKEDNGLTVRVSNAAAAALGVEDTKFEIQINY